MPMLAGHGRRSHQGNASAPVTIHRGVSVARLHDQCDGAAALQELRISATVVLCSDGLQT
jgi:hypothetical protein